FSVRKTYSRARFPFFFITRSPSPFSRKISLQGVRVSSNTSSFSRVYQKRLAVFNPASVGALCWISYLSSIYLSSFNVFQNRLKSRCTAPVNPNNGNIISFCFLGSIHDHLMGNCIGKQKKQIRTAHFFLDRAMLLNKYLCFTAIVLTEIFISCHHSFV